MKTRLRQFSLKSIIRRGKYFEIRFTNPRTQKREYYKLGTTRDEVKRNLPEFNRMYAGLKVRNLSYRITVAQGIQSWLEQKKTELSNANTIARYREIMDNFAEYMRSRWSDVGYMDELSQRHFEEFKEYRRTAKGKKERTINFELDMISNMFKCLIERDYLAVNPLSRVKRLQEPYREERWFTEDEVLRLLEVAKSGKSRINWYAIFATYYYTGMRKRELMTLTWEDVDFEREIILVRHKEGFKPKTDRPRGIPIHPGLMGVLRELHGGPFGERALQASDQGKLVFVNSRGKGFTKDAIRRKLKEFCEEAGIRPGKLHSFRHTWTAHSIMKGCPSDVVQAIGGWKQKDMIERYKHLAPDYMAEIFKKTEFLGRKTEENESL